MSSKNKELTENKLLRILIVLKKIGIEVGNSWEVDMDRYLAIEFG